MSPSTGACVALPRSPKHLGLDREQKSWIFSSFAFRSLAFDCAEQGAEIAAVLAPGALADELPLLQDRGKPVGLSLPRAEVASGDLKQTFAIQPLR